MKLSGDNNVVKLFLSDVKMRLEQHTLVSYSHILQVLATLLETVCGVTDLEKVTVIHLRQCVEHLQTTVIQVGKSRKPPENGKTLAVSTVRAHIRVWKAFFNWCYQEELIDKNPVVRLTPPRPTKRIIPAFSDEQVEKMLVLI